VLFLTDAGTSPVGDVRAASLQEAIRFASRWNLLGVVSAAEPLVMCPRLVKVVKESGLVCVSYGTLNNDPTNVMVSIVTRVIYAIVTDILAVAKKRRHRRRHRRQRPQGPKRPPRPKSRRAYQRR
jgi:glycerophosphodiester phosphodiesterase